MAGLGSISPLSLALGDYYNGCCDGLAAAGAALSTVPGGCIIRFH